MNKEIKVGSVSWINGTPSPIVMAAKAEILEPEWVPKTYMGLKATKNPAPGASLTDFKDFQGKKKFRSLTYLRFSVDIDNTTKALTGFKVLDAVHDPGWTPPFDYAAFPSSLLAAIWDKDIRDTNWYQGEASTLSVVQTEARHKNTTITGVPADETILANALIKFRAGSHTDGVGIKIGSPYHVPWVWNEWVLTYKNGDFKLYVRASKFPSHAWYFNDKQVHTTAEIGDLSFPDVARTPIASVSVFGTTFTLENKNPRQIDVPKLVLYPILSKGAPASGAQTSNGKTESALTGSVETHANTAPGWAVKILSV